MQYITFAIAIIGSVISVSSFLLNRKDKSNKDIKEEQKQFDKNNLIEYRLTKIEQNIEKILNKLDVYEKEIDDRIKVAIDNHVAIYHNKKGE